MWRIYPRNHRTWLLPMKAPYSRVLAAAVALIVCAATARAERTLFSDNFNSPEANPEKGGVNSATGESGRQSGSLAPFSYQQKAESGHQASIVAGQFVSGKGISGRGSPDHDFLADFEGTGIAPSLLFTFTFTTPQGGNFSNGSYGFFSLENAPGVFGDNPSGFGVLFSGTGKSQIYFAGSSEDFSYTTPENGVNKAAVAFVAAPDGSTDTITVTINEVKVQTYILGKGGFGQALKKLYVTFGTEFNATGTFDDLSIIAPTLPPK